MDAVIPKPESPWKEITLRSIASIVCCTILGFISWKWTVFNRYHTAFQFIAFGTIGSVFFHTLRFSLRNALAALLTLSMIISILVMRSHGLASVRDLFVSIATASILYLYFSQFYDRPGHRRLLEPLVLAVLFGLGNLVVFLLFVFIDGHAGTITLLWSYEVMQHWFLIGMGIGTGIILTEHPFSQKLRVLYHSLLGRAN